MGAYVNCENETKESWLEREGEEVASVEYDSLPENTLPVSCLDNGMFSAAGIGFSKSEWEMFNDPNDRRKKRLFLVDINKLHTVSPMLETCLSIYNNQR